jgi:hypothetical protein
MLSNACKSIKIPALGDFIRKLFSSSLMVLENKPECLLLANIYPCLINRYGHSTDAPHGALVDKTSEHSSLFCRGVIDEEKSFFYGGERKRGRKKKESERERDREE